MRLLSVDFNGEEDPKPTDVVVSMTIDEAYKITKVFGNMYSSANIYHQLVNVFNTYWDAGVDGYPQ